MCAPRMPRAHPAAGAATAHVETAAPFDALGIRSTVVQVTSRRAGSSAILLGPVRIGGVRPPRLMRGRISSSRIGARSGLPAPSIRAAGIHAGLHGSVRRHATTDEITAERRGAVEVLTAVLTTRASLAVAPPSALRMEVALVVGAAGAHEPPEEHEQGDASAHEEHWLTLAAAQGPTKAEHGCSAARTRGSTGSEPNDSHTKRARGRPNTAGMAPSHPRRQPGAGTVPPIGETRCAMNEDVEPR